MSVNGTDLGTKESEVRVKEDNSITVNGTVAVFLTGDRSIKALPVSAKQFWHIESAWIGDTEKVPVELIASGECIAIQPIIANGDLQDLEFKDIELARSASVALRILPSSHTNPVFVIVDGKLIRASRRGAQ